MGRSSAQKAAENRLKIVDCACTLFRAHGVDNVSVSDVMAANGMTVGGFYKHFASKDDLIAEVVARTFDQSAGIWLKVFEDADVAGLIKVEELVRQYLRNSAPERRCPILAFAPHVTAGESAAPAVEAYAAGTKRLFDVFISGQRNGRVQGGTRLGSQEAAMVLFAAMVGARVIKQALGDAAWVQEMQGAIRKFANDQ